MIEEDANVKLSISYTHTRAPGSPKMPSLVLVSKPNVLAFM